MSASHQDRTGAQNGAEQKFRGTPVRRVGREFSAGKSVFPIKFMLVKNAVNYNIMIHEPVRQWPQ